MSETVGFKNASCWDSYLLNVVAAREGTHTQMHWPIESDLFEVGFIKGELLNLSDGGRDIDAFQ